MMVGSKVDLLLELERRILAERSRVADSLHSSGDSLPPEILNRLAALHGAASGVRAEIARHTPTLGLGGED